MPLSTSKIIAFPWDPTQLSLEQAIKTLQRAKRGLKNKLQDFRGMKIVEIGSFVCVSDHTVLK